MANRKNRKASKKVVDVKSAAANDTTTVAFNITPRLTPEDVIKNDEAVTPRTERGTAVASGFQYNKLAGKPAKQQVIAVFGQSGYAAYSWVSRAAKLSMTPEALCEQFVADPVSVKELWAAATAKKETK